MDRVARSGWSFFVNFFGQLLCGGAMWEELWIVVFLLKNDVFVKDRNGEVWSLGNRGFGNLQG